MNGKHKRPLLAWRPPPSLGSWVRDEAKRRGLGIGEYLTILVEREREAREKTGAEYPVMPSATRENSGASNGFGGSDWRE